MAALSTGELSKYGVLFVLNSSGTFQDDLGYILMQILQEKARPPWQFVLT